MLESSRARRSGAEQVPTNTVGGPITGGKLVRQDGRTRKRPALCFPCTVSTEKQGHTHANRNRRAAGAAHQARTAPRPTTHAIFLTIQHQVHQHRPHPRQAQQPSAAANCCTVSRSGVPWPDPDVAMASATCSIPRFLLPQSGLIWRRAQAAVPASFPAPSPASASRPRRIFLRLASNSSSGSKQPPSGPRVLAKPERFNPPSHGARLPKKTTPRHYGGDLTADEATAQAVREYPGMAPPAHTRAHWFLHNRWIHVVITIVLSPPPPQKTHLFLSNITRAPSPAWPCTPSSSPSSTPRPSPTCCPRRPSTSPRR